MQGNCFCSGGGDSQTARLRLSYAGRLREVSRPWRELHGEWLRNKVMKENKAKPSCCRQNSYRKMFSNVLTSTEVVEKSEVIIFSIWIGLPTQ